MAEEQSRLFSSATLGDFVKHIAVEFTDRKGSFPFKDEEPWHEMLMEVQEKYVESVKFLKSVKFDYDEMPYPNCRKLTEFLQALHWSGALSVGNPSFSEAIVRPGLKKIWKDEEKKQDEAYLKAVEFGVESLIKFTNSEKKN
ncbi:MAG: hypothetical protein M1468_03715 [Candidatus Thermoplasmatota archaeon]|jgi:hypothetical protein|nr:hypothetical protein [Candidatus Thermoplasmatota archaeon]